VEGEDMAAMKMMWRWLVCRITGHVDEIERIEKGGGIFYSLGRCKRCHRQWWMKGERGSWMGVRFVKSVPRG
jgi:hypothetical protein